MIPWVMALIALVGLNALAPIHRLTKKHESSHESGLSEFSDDVQIRGRFSDPLVFSEPESGDEAGMNPSLRPVPRLETQSAQPHARATGGAVLGRAPPVRHSV